MASETDVSRNIIYDPVRGEYINVETGEVVSEGEIREGKDWRAFDAEDVMTRAHTGPGYTMKVHDGGITTFVDGRSRISKMQKILRRPSDLAGKREIEAKKRLNEIAGIISLPEILVEDAGYIIKKLAVRGVIKRKNLDYIVATVIYRVAYLRNIDLDKEVLMKTMSLDRRKFFETLKKLEWSEVFNDIREKVSRGERNISICGSNSIDRILSNIKLSDSVRETSIRILRSLYILDPSICSGKNPKGIVGAAIYIASIINNERISQQEIASKLNISEVTIRNRYKHILDKIDLVVFI